MRTKIVATIGPASSGKEMLLAMIKRGLCLARINFSHGSHRSNGELMKNIRQAAGDLGKNIGVITDLQGPRIRVKTVKDKLELKQDAIGLIFEGEQNLVNPSKKIDFQLGLDSKKLLNHLESGDSIYIDNGMMEARVIERLSRGLLCKVVVGGVIKPRKGVNIPKISPKMEAFTPSDAKNLEFALAQNVDFVAMSFVKTAADIKVLRKKIKKLLPNTEPEELPGIIAKIETNEAVKNFTQILDAVDGIMIARGDLGIEQPMEKIPALQKTMIKQCLQKSKPVIVATQMLESMMENSIPTRAEVTDVANAVIDHADAVMLSGETAMGKYPAKTIQTMRKIIDYTEEGPYDDLDFDDLVNDHVASLMFIAKSAVTLAREIEANSIIIKNSPLEVVYKISRFRPEMNIYFLTNNKYLSRKLSLLWGAEAIYSMDNLQGPFVVVDSVMEKNGQIRYQM
ncbi:MAG: pyruvate kinase [Candidatus Moranbacteria bacterium]|nr:pyruvate kinase [Candidatus Moranbacteria bacterium]